MILECCNCGMRIDDVTGKDVTMNFDIEVEGSMECTGCSGDVSK